MVLIGASGPPRGAPMRMSSFGWPSHGRPCGKFAPPATTKWPSDAPAKGPATPTGSGSGGSSSQRSASWDRTLAAGTVPATVQRRARPCRNGGRQSTLRCGIRPVRLSLGLRGRLVPFELGEGDVAGPIGTGLVADRRRLTDATVTHLRLRQIGRRTRDRQLWREYAARTLCRSATALDAFAGRALDHDLLARLRRTP